MMFRNFRRKLRRLFHFHSVIDWMEGSKDDLGLNLLIFALEHRLYYKWWCFNSIDGTKKTILQERSVILCTEPNAEFRMYNIMRLDYFMVCYISKNKYNLFVKTPSFKKVIGSSKTLDDFQDKLLNFSYEVKKLKEEEKLLKLRDDFE